MFIPEKKACLLDYNRSGKSKDVELSHKMLLLDNERTCNDKIGANLEIRKARGYQLRNIK